MGGLWIEELTEGQRDGERDRWSGELRVDRDWTKLMDGGIGKDMSGRQRGR